MDGGHRRGGRGAISGFRSPYLCFVAGTQVVVEVEYEDEEGKVRRISARKLARRGKGALATLPKILRYITVPIETLRPGDWVLAREEHEAEGELVLRQVEERFERTVYALVHLRLRDEQGREQVIRTTAEHPVYLLGSGWVAAGELRAGDTLGDPQGGVSIIVAVGREVHREGIGVYNLRVHQAHTYFVRAEGSDAEPVWVHNTYRDTFIDANAEAEGRVWVHHSVEQNVLNRYPGLFTEAEINQLSFLRGIPKEINSELHLSKFRRVWDAFYDRVQAGREIATRERILEIRDMLDRRYGSQFLPPV